MAKLKIEELKYIVMEGGGARGTAYLGAVTAMEDQLKELVEADIKNKNYCKAIVQDRKEGIMDYLVKENDIFNPIIKGVAGASAGAITTFALVLGLNSKEIEDDIMMGYSFEKFLKEKDPGVYRMIDEKSELTIGEDIKPNGAFDSLRLLGGKRTPFAYDLKKDRTNINGNLGKGIKRFFFVNLILKIIIDGVLVNLQQLSSAFDSNIKKDGPSWLSKFWNWFVVKSERGNPASNSSNPNQFIGSSTFSMGVSAALFTKLSYDFKFKITPNTVSSIFLDRGLYSGFQVREFFFDLLIYASTKDTLFQKKLVEYCNKQLNIKIDKSDLKSEFKIGNRKKYYDAYLSNNEKVKKIYTFLMNITFIEFYQILGVDYGVSVSNFSSKSPLYFSYNYTPNFRLLEAVAASMSIPPAIRPVYNESNVILSKSKDNLPFYSNGKFDRNEYFIYEHATKIILQRELLKEQIYVDLNNNINVYSYLNKLRDMVIGKYNESSMKFENMEFGNFEKVELIDSKECKVDHPILKYIYNAQFKGLLMDGGYFNNIPYNYFRSKNLQGLPVNSDENTRKETEMKGIFVIKLDNSFPADFMYRINIALAKYKSKEKQIRELIKSEDDVYLQLNDSNPFYVEYEKIICIIKCEFSVFFNNKKENTEKKTDGFDFFKLFNTKPEIKDRKAIIKILEKWLDEYGEKNNIHLWQEKKSILKTAFEGYSFGAEQGQIKRLSDNNHILPLYDFGVGVYDFDLSRVRPMIELAKSEAEKAVNKYFKLEVKTE